MFHFALSGGHYSQYQILLFFIVHDSAEDRQTGTQEVSLFQQCPALVTESHPAHISFFTRENGAGGRGRGARVRTLNVT